MTDYLLMGCLVVLAILLRIPKGTLEYRSFEVIVSLIVAVLIWPYFVVLAFINDEEEQ